MKYNIEMCYKMNVSVTGIESTGQKVDSDSIMEAVEIAKKKVEEEISILGLGSGHVDASCLEFEQVTYIEESK